MKRSTWYLAAAATAILGTACGSSDSGGGSNQPAAQPGQVNQQQAKSAAQATISAAVNVQSSNDGKQGANALEGAAAQAQGIIQPSAGATPSSLLGGTIGHIGQFVGGTDAGCVCDANAKSCTYTNCSPNGDTQLVINGKLDWSGGKVVATGLTYDVTGAGPIGNLKITLDCNLTVGATQIDGSMHTSGNTVLDTSDAGTGTPGAGSSLQYGWDTTIAYNAVTFSGGSPTGGSIDVNGTYSVNYGAAGLPPQSYSGSAHVTFP